MMTEWIPVDRPVITDVLIGGSYIYQWLQRLERTSRHNQPKSRVSRFCWRLALLRPSAGRRLPCRWTRRRFATATETAVCSAPDRNPLFWSSWRPPEFGRQNTRRTSTPTELKFRIPTDDKRIRFFKISKSFVSFNYRSTGRSFTWLGQQLETRSLAITFHVRNLIFTLLAYVPWRRTRNLRKPAKQKSNWSSCNTLKKENRFDSFVSIHFSARVYRRISNMA